MTCKTTCQLEPEWFYFFVELMSQKKWFMLFLSQLSVLWLLGLVWRADSVAIRWDWYQTLVLSCFVVVVLLLWWWISILFFDEHQLGWGQRILMMLLVPVTLLYFSIAWTLVVTKQWWSSWLVLLRTIWRLFVIIALVFIKGTSTTKKIS